MRDAATAAAMSDPEQNRWFRRRWVETAAVCTELYPPREVALPLEEAVTRTGLALLEEWRRTRDRMGIEGQQE